MPGRRANRPPPDDSPHLLPAFLRRRKAEPAHDDATADAAYRRSDAAEQERLITEALEDLRDMDVREVMTPRFDVVALSIPVSATDVVKAVRESGHSCFPVVNGELDDVVGVLYVNDLFRSRRAARASLLDDAGTPDAPGSGAGPGPRQAVGLSSIEISRRIRQPFVIPESRPILAALVEMRRNRRGFAVVVDEHGGVSGILTVKDLLEPIVGDLHDELDPVDEEPEIVRVDGSRWLVDGQTNVDDVRERLGIEVPEGDYVTLGGYLFDALGHIPDTGETLKIDGWELAVQEMDKRRIAKVLAKRREPENLDRSETDADAEADKSKAVNGPSAEAKAQPARENVQDPEPGSHVGAASGSTSQGE